MRNNRNHLLKCIAFAFFLNLNYNNNWLSLFLWARARDIAFWRNYASID